MNNCNKWSIDEKFSLLMFLDNGNFVVFHRNEECPHGHLVTSANCKYHHAVHVLKNNASISFVFRVSTIYAKFRNIGNTIVDHDVSSNVNKDIQKQILYKSIDNEKYHSDIKHDMLSVIH